MYCDVWILAVLVVFVSNCARGEKDIQWSSTFTFSVCVGLYTLRIVHKFFIRLEAFTLSKSDKLLIYGCSLSCVVYQRKLSVT
jgi:hypothetical protein